MSTKQPQQPSRTRRVLAAVFPFKKPAADALRPAQEGGAMIVSMLDTIKKQVNPDLNEEAERLDPAERFRRQCQRYGLDKARLLLIEQSLLNTKRVYLTFFYLLPVLALIQAITATTLADQAGALGCLLFSFLALVLSMRLSFQLRSVRHRKGWGWPQFCATFPTKVDMAAYFLDLEF
ncbi:MAG: hypothetical protein U1A72_20375 [Sulfuritalea sp.]|nr:hypothetical protein [Sulfuritalea sp.]